MGKMLYPLDMDLAGSSMLECPDYSSAYYCMSHSLSEIESYLKRIRACLGSNSFVVLTDDPDDEDCTRGKNDRFLLLYGLTGRKEQKQFLMSVDAQEFCHSIKTNDGRRLYVFCAERELFKAAVGYEKVRVYVKHDYSPGARVRDVIVSLHELEKPIMLAFDEW